MVDGNEQKAVENHRQPTPRRVVVAEGLFVTALFVAIGLFYTYPLWKHPASYIVEPGDPLQHLAVAYWVTHRLLEGRFTGIWNVPPMYWPAHNTLAYGDPQFGTVVLSLPFYLAAHSIVLAYNVLVIAAMPLSALAAYLLTRRMTGCRLAALFAGVVWGYCRWHSGEAAHQQILSVWGFPIVLLAVDLYGETRKARYLALLFVAWLVQEFLAEYWAAFLVLLIGPTAILLLRYRWRVSWRGLITPILVALLALAPWAVLQPHFLSTGTRHPRAEIDNNSADMADYLPARGSVLYGKSGRVHYLAGAQVAEEAMISPGLLALALAAWGAATAFRVKRLPSQPLEETRKWEMVRRVGWVTAIVATAGIMMLMMLGADSFLVFHIPDWLINATILQTLFIAGCAAAAERPIRRLRQTIQISVTPERKHAVALLFLALFAGIWSNGYVVAFQGFPIAPGIHGFIASLPGGHSFRALVRMGILADLGIVVLAGMGLIDLARRFRQLRGNGARIASTAACCLLALGESWPAGGTPFNHSGPKLPRIRAVDRWLAQQPAGPVLNLPLTVDAYTEGERLWRQTVHHHPMVNGAETFFPRGYYNDVHLFAAPMSPAAIARVHQLGIAYIVMDLHNPYTGRKTVIEPVPAMPATLSPTYHEIYRDADAAVYRP
jgi:hypothetical protein